MKLGLIGLGKMGMGIASRLVKDGHEVVAFDVEKSAQEEAQKRGASPAKSLESLVALLEPPRVLWMMVPSGGATAKTVLALEKLLMPSDILVDGGNSNYKDSIAHFKALKEKGVHFVDVGTSGGIWGEKNGFCLMIGGEDETIDKLKPVFETLSSGEANGYGHVGPAGAGHFVKMVHNGIEYGAMQAFAEGFALLQSKKEFGIDLEKVGKIWQQGSVVRSWLLDLIVRALGENPSLKGIAPFVRDSGEGRWTVQEALDQDVACPVITLALLERFASRDNDAFQFKLLSALRHQFGGHEIKKN